MTPVEEYQITIDDSVSMTDFNEHFEIVRQEGKIYTVRARGGSSVTQESK